MAWRAPRRGAAPAARSAPPTAPRAAAQRWRQRGRGRAAVARPPTPHRAPAAPLRAQAKMPTAQSIMLAAHCKRTDQVRARGQRAAAAAVRRAPARRAGPPAQQPARPPPVPLPASAPQLDIKGPISAYIKTTYSAAEAASMAEDLATLQGLRNDLVTAQGSATGNPRKDQLVK
jgi:hypothetical protein